jgi:Cu/Ag efflux pump CusA
MLIAYQALSNIRHYGMHYHDAILESAKTRLRPIYMSTFTSIFGMLPLVVAPGPGLEIYRGLGSVILGGLATSSTFVIFIIPSLLHVRHKNGKDKTRELEKGKTGPLIGFRILFHSIHSNLVTFLPPHTTLNLDKS